MHFIFYNFLFKIKYYLLITLVSFINIFLIKLSLINLYLIFSKKILMKLCIIYKYFFIKPFRALYGLTTSYNIK